MKKLIDTDWSKTPPEIAHLIHRFIREETGINDPYMKAKKDSNDRALALIPKIKGIINKSSDPLEAAVRISIAGNIMDFGPFSNFDIERTLEDSLRKKFAINDFPRFKKEIMDAGSILFFTDNAGEILFDKLLIETILELKREDGKSPNIAVVLKGGPIINDATLEDAKYIGMNTIPSIEFKTISNGDPNTGPIRNSEEVRRWIDDYDVTIAKGQGNYEGLSQFKKIYFLLIVKCNVIASDLAVSEGDIVLKHSY
jgi:uncharacterized protein with ATP-grasp and redox domains